MSISVGIDIGASAVKVAVLRVAYRKTAIEALATVEIAGDVEGAVRAAFTQALAGKPADAIAAAIEGIRASVHTLSLPASAQKQLGEILPFELEAALPVDMSDSVFDYRVLDARSGSLEGAATLPVLAVVARIEDVRARIDLVRNAVGMEPERVGAGALTLASLVGSIPALSEPGTHVVVDLGTRTSEIVVVADGEAVFARTASFGTQGLPGTAPKLARDLRVTLGAYRSAGGAAPSRVYLCGGGAFVSGAQAFLSSELDLPVETLPPIALEAAPTAIVPVTDLPRYAKAIALALGLTSRGQLLDLRRGPLSFERGFAWVREKIPILAGLGAVLAVSFYLTIYTQLRSANADQETLESALGTVSGEVLGEETTSASRALELVSQQSGGADDDPMPHVDAFDVMVKLSEDIPQSTQHDVEELDVQKQHATVHGIVGTIPEAQTIKSSLEGEKCFKEVNVSRFTKVVGGDRQKYVLDIDLKCPEDSGGKKAKKKEPAAAASGSGGTE